MQLLIATEFRVDHSTVDCIFMSFEEAALADERARLVHGKISGTFPLNVALNRYRHSRCMFCGAGIGQPHRDCTYGKVNTAPYAE